MILYGRSVEVYVNKQISILKAVRWNTHYTVKILIKFWCIHIVLTGIPVTLELPEFRLKRNRSMKVTVQILQSNCQTHCMFPVKNSHLYRINKTVVNSLILWKIVISMQVKMVIQQRIDLSIFFRAHKICLVIWLQFSHCVKISLFVPISLEISPGLLKISRVFVLELRRGVSCWHQAAAPQRRSHPPALHCSWWCVCNIK